MQIDAGFADLPHLLPAIVSAVQNEPAGRTAAFVLADPAQRKVDPTDDELQSIGFAPWAGAGLIVSVNADPHEAHERAANLIAARAAEDAATPGVRTDERWMSEILDRAAQQPPLAVPFPLPPALPAHVWAGAPAPVFHAEADPETGGLTIRTADGELEVVGLPGNAPQFVGAAVDAPVQTQAWLRAAHERWWTHQPVLHDRVHEVIDGFLDGTLELVADEGQPHLHMPNLDVRQIAWPLPGELTVEPVREDAEPLVLGVRVDEDGTKENVGAIIVHESCQIEAFLHDEWRPWLPDHEGALQHLLALGAEGFIAGALHDALDAGVTAAILTSDVVGH